MEDYLYDYDGTNYEDIVFAEDNERTFKNVWNLCIKPSVTQITVYAATFLTWNILFRLTTQTVIIPMSLRHLSSIIIGGIVLYFTIGYGGFYLIGFSVATYFVFLILSMLRIKKRGFILGTFCISVLALCELFEKNVKIWHQIRGTQMIAAMKLISLGFDLDSGRVQQTPDILGFFGYALCPANSVLGPWIPFTEYLSIFDKPKWGFQWFLRIITNSSFAILFLILSNCIISILISDTSWKWFRAYRDAMSFRSSHYFITFLSQSIMVSAGFSNDSDSYFFGYQITKPLLIELPRSIVQVVVIWNIPMHNWLKFYVFRNMRQYGTFTAILITYLISSLLHGLNFQLSAVLLSLGFYTYVEYKLRQKLCIVFSACILASSCRNNCLHQHKINNIYVIIINLLFGIIAIIHLAYLGVMFEASSNIQEEGFSYLHALEKWNTLNFMSHWIVGFSYLFYVLI